MPTIRRTARVIHPPPEPMREPEPIVPGLPRDARRWAVEIVQVVLFAAVLYLVVTTFVAQPFAVQLMSMQPTLEPGDHLLVDRLSPRWDAYDRGDIVVFHPPPPLDGDGIPYVKRIIGVPGDVVEIANGRVYLTEPGGVPRRLEEPYVTEAGPTLAPATSDAVWHVPEGAVFVLGDNRAASADSRTFGAVPLDRIVGRAFLRYLPLDRMSVIAVAD